MICSIQHFAYYLVGRTFKIFTDHHKALIDLFNSQYLNNQLWRWKMKLFDYNFSIQYVEGRENPLSDSLSRQGWTSEWLQSSSARGWCGYLQNKLAHKNSHTNLHIHSVAHIISIQFTNCNLNTVTNAFMLFPFTPLSLYTPPYVLNHSHHIQTVFYIHVSGCLHFCYSVLAIVLKHTKCCVQQLL